MISSRYYHGRLCDSNLSYEYFAQPPLTLDLAQLASELSENGIMFEIKTPFVLVFGMEGTKISLYPSGKLLFKNLNVEKDAEALFKKFIALLNECSSVKNA